MMKDLTDQGYSADYLTLDDLNLLSYVRQDPQNFVDSLRGPVVIDEVQRVPDLLIAIKRSVDRDRRPGRFLLTGSARVLQIPNLSETLAGRMEIMTLWPFSEGELNGVCDGLVDRLFSEQFDLSRAIPTARPVFEAISAGGFPEIVDRPSDRRAAWFRSYVQSVVEREIRDLANLAGLTEIPRLLAVLASRLGGLLNYTDVATIMKMPQTTLKRYLALLETVFLFHPVPAWSTSRGSMLAKSPRVYLNDPGLATYLLDLDEERLATLPRPFGSLLENYVMAELEKQITWSRKRPMLYHFRTQAGHEVDFVLESQGGQVVGIEVKASGTLDPRDWKGMQKLRELAGDRFVRGIILYRGDTILPVAPNLYAVPLQYLQTALPAAA